MSYKVSLALPASLQKGAPSALVSSVGEAVINHPTCREEVNTTACAAWEIQITNKTFHFENTAHFLLFCELFVQIIPANCN